MGRLGGRFQDLHWKNFPVSQENINGFGGWLRETRTYGRRERADPESRGGWVTGLDAGRNKSDRRVGVV